MIGEGGQYNDGLLELTPYQKSLLERYRLLCIRLNEPKQHKKYTRHNVPKVDGPDRILDRQTGKIHVKGVREASKETGVKEVTIYSSIRRAKPSNNYRFARAADFPDFKPPAPAPCPSFAALAREAASAKPGNYLAPSPPSPNDANGSHAAAPE